MSIPALPAVTGRDPKAIRYPPFCRGLGFADQAVKSAQIGLFRKLLAGCRSFTVGVVTSVPTRPVHLTARVRQRSSCGRCLAA